MKAGAGNFLLVSGRDIRGPRTWAAFCWPPRLISRKLDWKSRVPRSQAGFPLWSVRITSSGLKCCTALGPLCSFLHSILLTTQHACIHVCLHAHTQYIRVCMHACVSLYPSVSCSFISLSFCFCVWIGVLFGHIAAWVSVGKAEFCQLRLRHMHHGHSCITSRFLGLARPVTGYERLRHCVSEVRASPPCGGFTDLAGMFGYFLLVPVYPGWNVSAWSLVLWCHSLMHACPLLFSSL